MPDVDEASLRQWREEVAAATGGESGDTIHQLFERVIEERDLSGSVLDFGAGVGNLTRCLAGMGRFESMAAADLLESPPGLPDTVEWRKEDLNDRTGFESGRFDVIVSAEVIEHLENPRAVAREWRRLLKPGGEVLFSTPNNESWRSIFAMAGRGHFAQFDNDWYPAHITALLRKDMQWICREAGMEFVTFYYTGKGNVPKLGWSWQALSFGLLRGCRFSDNLMAVARVPN